MVAEPPVQMAVGVELAVTVGVGLTVTVTVEVFVHPLDGFVAVAV
jgi:hypothetical protein